MSALSASPGFETIEQEFEACLRKAFVERRYNSIAIYSRRQQFQAEAANYGVERGWLTEGELVELDSQSSEIRYRLTDEGKAHFGLQV